MNEWKPENGKYVSQYLTHFVGKALSDECAFRLLCKILREGDEKALGALAAEYELTQDELVFACDALLALRMKEQALKSILGVRY